MRKLSDDNSGSWRRRPNSVVVYPDDLAEDLAGLVGGNVESLREPVGLHAVGEPVVDDLREPALELVDLGLVDVEHLGRGGGVHVGTALERVDQARVFGEVREHAQLNL